jgi:hypothetical protein
LHGLSDRLYGLRYCFVRAMFFYDVGLALWV